MTKVDPHVVEDWLLARADLFEYRYDRRRPADGVEILLDGEVIMRFDPGVTIGPRDSYVLNWMGRSIDVPILPKPKRRAKARHWLKAPA